MDVAPSQQAERYKDLRALLKLLTNLSHRDWSDACAAASAEARQSAGDDVAQVCGQVSTLYRVVSLKGKCPMLSMEVHLTEGG